MSHCRGKLCYDARDDGPDCKCPCGDCRPAMTPPDVKAGDRIIWHGRTGLVKDIDTSAQKTARGRALGWPFAAWVLFDDRASDPDAWTCVNAFHCKRLQGEGPAGQ